MVGSANNEHQVTLASTWKLMGRPLLYVAGLVPAVWTFYQGMTDQLGADPINTLERLLGLWSLRFLLIGLAITPLRQLTGVNLIKYRRAVGLLAFFYACFHLLVYMVLDQGLDWWAIWQDIIKRPYITVGMFTFIILVPLAVTSNNAMIRRVGAQTWRQLHKLVYVAVIGGCIHFIMLVKAWPPEPLVYLAIALVLLSYRVVAGLGVLPGSRGGARRRARRREATS